MTSEQPNSEQTEVDGVIITDDYATPSLPKTVAQDLADADEAVTRKHDQEAVQPNAVAAPAGGGGVALSAVNVAPEAELKAEGDGDESDAR